MEMTELEDLFAEYEEVLDSVNDLVLEKVADDVDDDKYAQFYQSENLHGNQNSNDQEATSTSTSIPKPNHDFGTKATGNGPDMNENTNTNLDSNAHLRTISISSSSTFGSHYQLYSSSQLVESENNDRVSGTFSQKSKKRFVLLSIEEQRKLELVPCIRDDTFDLQDDGSDLEIEAAESNASLISGEITNSQGGNDRVGHRNKAELEESYDTIYGGDGFIRIKISEEEYWDIEEAHWENSISNEKQTAGLEESEEENEDDSASSSSNSSRNSQPQQGYSSPTTAKKVIHPTIIADGQEKTVTELSPREWAHAVKVSEEILGYDSFQLPIVYEYRRTGFEATKELTLNPEMLIAGRYEFKEQLSEAAFSITLKCMDIKEEREVCVKVIKNNKDFFDQSLDEIKLLQYLNRMGDADEKRFLRLYDYFYHKEHLFIVTELLKEDLYQAYTKDHSEDGGVERNGGNASDIYFTLERLKTIARQCLKALEFVHSLGLIHCDLKPENIMMENYDKTKVKLIDFGSSCFTTDYLTNYIQSRYYRAPEVILGVKYNQKIDIWSLGCVLVELYSGRVLFDGSSAPEMLAKMVNLVGPFPKSMINRADQDQIDRFFLQKSTLFERCKEDENAYMELLYPRQGDLKQILKSCPDSVFVELIQLMLTLDPDLRPSADFCLQHSWFRLPEVGETEIGKVGGQTTSKNAGK